MPTPMYQWPLMVIVLNLILHFLTESLVLSNDHQRWWSQEYLRFNAFRGYAQVDRWADTHCAFPIPDECPWSQPFYLYQPIKKSHQDSLLWKQRLLAVHQETWTWKIQNQGIAGIIDKSHHFPSAQLASGGSWIWWKIARKAASHLTKQFVLWYNTKQLKSCNVGCEDVMNLRNLSQEELIKMINEKDKKIEALTEQLNWYSQQIKLQQKKLFGSSSEKTVLPDQISLFDEIELESTPIKQEPELEEITYRRKRKSRQRGIDISSLPVKKVIHDIDNKSCPECGALLRKIGENKRKELVYHPARYEVIEHIQYVYTCDRCDREAVQSPIYKAPMKEPVIYKSFASPSLLSYIIDNKFNKALPLYRQEVMFNQMGLKLSRQTMANWMIKLHDEYFRTIASHMHKVLLKSQYLHGDELCKSLHNSSYVNNYIM